MVIDYACYHPGEEEPMTLPVGTSCIIFPETLGEADLEERDLTIEKLNHRGKWLLWSRPGVCFLPSGKRIFDTEYRSTRRTRKGFKDGPGARTKQYYPVISC